MKLKINVGYLPSFKKNKKLYAIVALLILIILIATAVLAKREENRLTDQYNRQVIGLTTASTRYLVSYYDLYYSSPTIKHKTLMRDFLSKNVILEKFQISNAAGNIVFDSSNYESTPTAEEAIGREDLDFSRKSEPTYLYEANRIERVISPYFEDWGAHNYTVIYTLSFDETNGYVVQFRTALVAIAALLIVLVAGAVSVFIITEQFRINKIEKKKLEIIDAQRREFLILASHNLRTPLTLINGYTSLLAETKLSKEQLGYIITTNESIDRLSEITENMLTIAGIQNNDSTSKPEEKGEKFLIQDVINEILEKNTVPVDNKSLKINTVVEPKGLALMTHKIYLTRLLAALITNAIKFNKDNGRVDIGVVEKGKYVHIKIADTGVGITEKEQKNAYSIFHRSSSTDPYIYDYEGVGIGLYMSKLLVDQLGGDIHFESSIKKGTTFFVDIPKSN